MAPVCSQLVGPPEHRAGQLGDVGPKIFQEGLSVDSLQIRVWDLEEDQAGGYPPGQSLWS